MNKILSILVLTSATTFAATRSDSTANQVSAGSRLDSVLKVESELWHKDSAAICEAGKRDSVAFDADLAKLPDSVKTAIKIRRAEIEARVAELQKLESGEIKARLDSLGSEHKARRDSVIAKFPEAVQARIKADVAEIDARRTELRTRIEADRTALKGRIAAAKLAKGATAATAP